MKEPRPIGTQFTVLIPPSAQTVTSEYDGLWIADTYEVTGHKQMEVCGHKFIGEKTKIIETQKIKREVQHCKICGQLLEWDD